MFIMVKCWTKKRVICTLLYVQETVIIYSTQMTLHGGIYVSWDQHYSYTYSIAKNTGDTLTL